MKIRRDGSPWGATGPIIPPTIGDKPVHVLAPAKINLWLEVLDKRPDGYHEIETLILAVDLCDELAFALDDSGTLSLTCNETELSTGDDNLVRKAARLLRERTGCSKGARIHLEKRIPWAAGLGGGSSDAAAALAGLNELWALQLPIERLAALGGELGSDVPFFFYAPAAWCRGRGEKVEAVAVGRSFDIVLVKPVMGLSTAEVYREIGKRHAGEVLASPDAALAALKSGDVEALARSLRNRLQEPAMKLCPPVLELFQRMEALGAAGCLLSGSGSCLFALCRDKREAERVIDGLRCGRPPGDELAGTRVFLVESCLEDRHRP